MGDSMRHVEIPASKGVLVSYCFMSCSDLQDETFRNFLALIKTFVETSIHRWYWSNTFQQSDPKPGSVDRTLGHLPKSQPAAFRNCMKRIQNQMCFMHFIAFVKNMFRLKVFGPAGMFQSCRVHLFMFGLMAYTTIMFSDLKNKRQDDIPTHVHSGEHGFVIFI